MFSNFAWSEMLVIACVAIIVVGPKDLPGMLRGLGKTIGNVKRMANDFQRQFNDALKDAELDEITDIAKNKTIAPLEDAKNAMNDIAKGINDEVALDPGAESAVTPTGSQKEPASGTGQPAKAKAAPKKRAAPAKKPASTRTKTSATVTKTAAKRKTTAKAAAKKPAKSAT